MNAPYKHPASLEEFETIYDREYQQELESCENWIKWCKDQGDLYGVNFYEGMQAARRFNDIKMRQLLRVLKQESPNRRETGVAKLNKLLPESPHPWLKYKKLDEPGCQGEQLRALPYWYHRTFYPGLIRFYHRHRLDRFFTWNHR